MNATDLFLQIADDANANQTIYQIINNTEYKMDNPLTWQWKFYYYFEKSPAYWCYEHVAFLFNKLMVPQGTKFFALLRDPIKRTYSYWSHQFGIKNIRDSWVQYVHDGMNDKHIRQMIVLLKDASKNIMQIKDTLLKEWRAYTYASDKSYGYIGPRDGNHKKSGKWGKGLRDFRRFNRGQPRSRKKSRKSTFGRKLLNETRRRRLWSESEAGYVAADTNSYLGVGASCYVIPLLMWLEYIPTSQMSVMQSELMYGGNHNDFISDVRCWYSNGYEYASMDACKRSGDTQVIVTKEHKTKSAKKEIPDRDARSLYNGLYKHCNERLKELMELDEYRSLPLHQMQWDKWYS